MGDAPEFALAKKGLRRQKTNRLGFVGEWQEPKLLTIYAVDEQGKRVNTDLLCATNNGTFGNVEPFMELLEMHLVRLGINQAETGLTGSRWC